MKKEIKKGDRIGHYIVEEIQDDFYTLFDEDEWLYKSGDPDYIPEYCYDLDEEELQDVIEEEGTLHKRAE